MASAQAGHGSPVPIGDRRALILSGLLTRAYFVIELRLVVGLGRGCLRRVPYLLGCRRGSYRSGGPTAERASCHPAHTFGWGRAEIIGALFNGLFLAVMAAYVLWMGVMRLMEPMSTTVILYAAAGGIVTEVVAFWLLYERQKGNLNIKGGFLAHPPDVRRSDHHPLGAGGPLDGLSCDRPASRHGLWPRPLLGLQEHYPSGFGHPAAEHARRARHGRGGHNAARHRWR